MSDTAPPGLPIEVEIAARDDQGDGIAVLDLVAVEGHTLPPFEPGAHVDVGIAPGLVRQYSLCGDPVRTDRYRIGILRDAASRGGSTAAHAAFRVGSRLRIGRPRNHFPLAPDATAVLVGGGIGITPLLAMAHHLDRAGLPFVLHDCVRSRAKAAFLAELAGPPFLGRTHLHLDDGPPEHRFDPARDLPPADGGAHLYVCGPSGFMQWVIAAARVAGYPEARIHREDFGAEVDRSGTAFEVVLAGSGRVVAVGAEQSIVQALAAVGVRVPVSCEEGVCGTCLCDVLEGVPDHRDSYLTDEEKAANDQMTPCCSRSRTPRLVLGL